MSWEPDISRALTNNAVVRRVTRQLKSWMGHPVLEHHKWHFLVLGVLVLVAVPWGLRAEERSLEDAGVQALAEAGIPVADITFNGRDAVVAAPASSSAVIESALADVAGVRTITVVDAELASVTADASQPEPSPPPPTTATPPPPTTSTTTTSVVPPEPTLVIEVGHSVRIAGSLPDALTVAALSDIAEFMYGGLVTNELFVDSTLPEPVWQESADDLLRAAVWLSHGSLELRGDEAKLTGTAATDELAGALVSVIQTKLGADVPLDHEVGSDPNAAVATFEIVAGADTVEVRGTVPDVRILQRITTSVEAVREEAEVTAEMAIGENTASTYVTLRTPYMIRLLGTAAEFTYRHDETEIRGSVVGGAFLDGEDVTRAMGLLVDALAATMLADDDLAAAIEIHSDSADSSAANTELSLQRARVILRELVRAGIDPARITVGPGDGAGELLRFVLTPTENK